MKLSLLPLTAAIAIATSAYAEEITPLSEVVVTATRTAEASEKVLASVQVINHETLDKYAEHDLSEVLRFEAGLNVVRLGGFGGQTSIFTRGTESNHTLVMIDGVRINPSTSSIANIQNLSLSDIERIEVVKGSLSSLYGSDAIGGTINIITKNPEKTAGSLSATTGSNGFRKGDLNQNIKSGNFSASIDANALYTDGYDIIEDQSLERGQKSEGGGIKLNADIGQTRLSLQGRINTGTTEYINFGTPATQDFRNDLLAFTVKSKLTESLGTELRLSEMNDNIDQNESASLARTSEKQADWQNTWTASPNYQLIGGATLTNTEGLYSNGFGTDYDKEEDKWGVYLQQLLTIDMIDTQLALRHDNYDSFGGKNTGNVGIGFTINENNRIYANYGTAYHAPDLNDLYGYGGNPLLKPEESQSSEIGSKHQLGDVALNIALFNIDIDNLVSCVGGYPCTNVNVEEARSQGVEAGINWKQNGFFAGATANYTKATNEQTGENLLRRPRRNATLNGGYGDSLWGSSVQLQASNHSYDAPLFGSTVQREVPGYAVVNLEAYWQVQSFLKLRLNVDNVSNKVYGQAYAGTSTLYLNTPRSAYITAALAY
jgi:vitamin B12 transporter